MWGHSRQHAVTSILAAALTATSAVLSAAPPPVSILPTPTPAPATQSFPAAFPTPPAAPPTPIPEAVLAWNVADAGVLLGVIEGIDSEGLIPADYRPDALRSAIAAGPGIALNAAASQSFAWLAEDLRDGRTPMTARLQWFALDPDQDAMPTAALEAKALDSHDVAGVLTGLAPTHPDYAVLKAALAATPTSDKAMRSKLRANMDRWRWLKQDLGPVYLMTNVPEFQLRLTVNNNIIRTYRTIVGKPGRTATPQLAEMVQNVVFNPTWTVPQSIVVGEGMGARLIRDPAAARRQGYAVSRAKDGTISVVQQPGRGNSLGLMKIDMPNPHAIYLHDTPSRNLFNAPVRAFSHGCIRTERAQELGMTMAMLGADLTVDQAVAYANSGKYTKVPMTKTFPVYIAYFTMARDISGKLATFNDIYGRDAPVLASFNAARQLKTSQRTSNEAIIKLDNPL
ncbi:MAG TPA: L,D-transpeptidase family protein [Novosphingobium sp.]|nr:L,D-transpeptidase family protein [Novosphingobium sp.]